MVEKIRIIIDTFIDEIKRINEALVQKIRRLNDPSVEIIKRINDLLVEKKWIKGDPNDDPDYDYRLTGKLFHLLKK